MKHETQNRLRQKARRNRKWGIPALSLLFSFAVIGCSPNATVSQNKPAANQIPSSNSINNPVDPGSSLHGRPAPDFTLKDQFSKSISLSQFHGKVVVLAFVDSECTTICPLTTQSMMDALKQLGPSAAKDVQLLGIDANPTAISISDVLQYSKDHDMLNSWHFLTGSLSQLKQVWRNYYIYTGIVNGQIDHTPALYIIDPKGHEQILYLTPSQYGAVSAQASVIAHDIARFLPSKVRPKLTNVTYKKPSFGTDSVISLPTETPAGTRGSVQVGPGKPQLLVFFATWVPQIEQELKQLNSLAAVPGHPEVVGIDVASAEPALNSVQSTLQKAGELQYPVALDKSGNVADAYQAQDLMWLTLTDGAGHIIWSHDGFEPVSQLSKDVKNALTKAKGAKS